jgi:hypothetical protein
MADHTADSNKVKAVLAGVVYASRDCTGINPVSPDTTLQSENDFLGTKIVGDDNGTLDSNGSPHGLFDQARRGTFKRDCAARRLSLHLMMTGASTVGRIGPSAFDIHHRIHHAFHKHGHLYPPHWLVGQPGGIDHTWRLRRWRR